MKIPHLLFLGCITAAVFNGCEAVMPIGLTDSNLNRSVYECAGRPVPPQAPRYAYRPIGEWEQRRVTGYQRFGPFTSARGRQYMVVRTFYSDGSYEDSRALY